MSIDASSTLKLEVLIPASKIQARVAEMGDEITAAYRGLEEPLVIVSILRGAFFFTADLTRQIRVPMEFDFVQLQSEPPITLTKELTLDIKGRHVLVVEDIVDTGRSTNFLHEWLAKHGPASVKLAALLDKPSKRIVDVPIDFRGFEVPDRFVIGYGLDLDQKLRELPDICAAVLE